MVRVSHARLLVRDGFHYHKQERVVVCAFGKDQAAH